MAALTQHRYFRNRVTQTPLQGGYSFNPTINPANNHITTSGYTYDAAGNMTNDSYHTYTYDAEGNVTQVDSGSTAQYVYDVFNRRIHVQTPSATTEYTYDYAGVYASDGTGTLRKQLAKSTSPVTCFSLATGVYASGFTRQGLRVTGFTRQTGLGL